MARSQWWIVQASIMGTCVAVALAAGIIIMPKTLAAKPLEQMAPATAAALQQSVDNLTALLGQADDEVADAMGVGADTSQDYPAAGAASYASTWLGIDDSSVVGVTTILDQCRTAIHVADDTLDGTKTVVSMFNRTNVTTTPQVIPLDSAKAMPATLDGCWDKVKSALSAMDEGLQTAKTAAALDAATMQYAGMVDTVKQDIADANDVLGAHTTAAQADARTALSAQIDAAQALVDEGQGATWQDIDQQSINLSNAAQSLDEAITALKAIQAAQTYTGGNGRLDPSTLCSVPYDTKQLLRCDAEAAWMRLDAAYKDVWGVDIPIDLSYRTYDEQVEMKQIYGSGAATPGYSNHGWGTAVDLPDYREGGEGLEWNYGTPKYEWMKANAPAYGWINPSWAVQGGVGPHEPWHFEYVG